MEGYKEFVYELQTDLQRFLSTPRDSWQQTAIKYVDGFAADELRRLISLQIRKENGAFFTDSLLAKQVLSHLAPKFNKKSFVYDPACGAGNLLVAVSNYISLSKFSCINHEILLGSDIHNEFVEATKLRLYINFLLKSIDSSSTVSNNVNLFDTYNVIKADGLVNNNFYEKATHIVVNPPFNLILPNENLNWSKGKVSAAALFVDKIVQYVNAGVSIIAILPDVLRSGSRYEKWRNIIHQKCVIKKVKLLGQFDKYADVDVFAINLLKKKRLIPLSNTTNPFKKDKQGNKQCIDELYNVCVGPVVDNRDPYEGLLLEYVISKGLEGWTEKKKIDLTRKHKGRSFASPFVVVKRTSRKGDSHRAIATIINSPNPVYVDNHLIILIPKSGALTDCQKALNILKDTRTNQWLNNQIRCRHLTVKVVSKIPLWQ